jgi:hypothetical protein
MGSCHIRLSSVTGSLEWDIKKEKWGIEKFSLNWFYWFDLFNWFVKAAEDLVGLQAHGQNTMVFEGFEINRNELNQCNQLNQSNNLLFFKLFDLF